MKKVSGSGSHFHPSLIFEGKDASRVGSLVGSLYDVWSASLQGATTFSIMTLNIKRFSITTLSIKDFCDPQQNNTLDIVPSG
jgi:hypothetical protein